VVENMFSKKINIKEEIGGIKAQNGISIKREPIESNANMEG
jgi:hypothetical protein